MGGCCCCASGQADPDRTPIYIYELEDNEPLPISHVTPTAVPVGLLVDTNLATSIPDTYQAPPVPLPYDVGRAETVCQNIESCGNKTDNVQTMNPLAVGENVTAAGFEKSDTCEGLKGIECKGKSDSPKVKEGEILKSDDPFSSAMYEEDVCPTCLEEYDKENPRIITKCEHHFHLSCILEWMERSNTCPICDQVTIFASGPSDDAHEAHGSCPGSTWVVFHWVTIFASGTSDDACETLVWSCPSGRVGWDVIRAT